MRNKYGKVTGGLGDEFGRVSPLEIFLSPTSIQAVGRRCARLDRMATHRSQLDEYCTEVCSDVCCRHKVMYGNSKNVIAMSQSAILLSVEAERELTRTLNPAVIEGINLPSPFHFNAAERASPQFAPQTTRVDSKLI